MPYLKLKLSQSLNPTVIFYIYPTFVKDFDMSFQAYINNIQTKTGKGPKEFRELAEQKGFTQNGQLMSAVKAGDVIKWLKADFDLGHGHAMAIYALLKGVKNEDSE